MPNNNDNKKSLFDLIESELQTKGCISDDFSLPQTDSKMKFAPGAMDGIMLYHGNSDYNQTDIEDLKKAFLSLSDDDISEGEKIVEKYFAQEGNSALSAVDNSQKWLVDSYEQVNPMHVVTMAMDLIYKSNNVETIKFSLTIFELINVEDVDEIREAILKLALYEEFTLFCLFVIRHWEDSNEVIFDLAQKLHSWGKIHTVERLEVADDEMKNWLIRHGCENKVLNQYLVPNYLEKINVLQLLKDGNITKEQFLGLSVVIEGLCMNEGPFGDMMANIDSSEEIIIMFLQEAKKHVVNLGDAIGVGALNLYLEKIEKPSQAVIQIKQTIKDIMVVKIH